MGTATSFQAAHRASQIGCHLSVQQTRVGDDDVEKMPKEIHESLSLVTGVAIGFVRADGVWILRSVCQKPQGSCPVSARKVRLDGMDDDGCRDDGPMIGVDTNVLVRHLAQDDLG